MKDVLSKTLEHDQLGVTKEDGSNPFETQNTNLNKLKSEKQKRIAEYAKNEQEMSEDEKNLFSELEKLI